MGYEFSKCVKADDGAIYCWDCVIKEFVKLNPQVVPPASIPENVLKLLMQRVVEDAKEK